MADRLHWDTDGARWPHRAASRFVVVDGVRWHVQVAGQGPALWLLHGTGAASHSWRALLPLLTNRATVVVPDLPGHGFSDALPAHRQSLPGMAAALAGLARALALPPAVLVGHSAGAALAAQAVLDGHFAPQLLAGVNAALLPFGGPAHPLFAGVARWLSRSRPLPWLLARRARDLPAVRRLVLTTGSQLDDAGLALYATLLRSPAHLRGVLAMVGHWNLDSLWRALPRLRPAPLLLVGGADATVPPAQADRVAAHCPGTRVLCRPGLGHLAHEEAPDWVAQALLAAWAAAAQPLDQASAHQARGRQ